MNSTSFQLTSINKTSLAKLCPLRFRTSINKTLAHLDLDFESKPSSTKIYTSGLPKIEKFHSKRSNHRNLKALPSNEMRKRQEMAFRKKNMARSCDCPTAT